MQNLKKLVSGAFLGGAILAVGAMVAPQQVSAATPKFAVSCDGNYCCSINQETGVAAHCWYR